MKNDRTNWPSGSWDNEPDLFEWEIYGMPCFVKRNNFGSWCGYVGLSKDHPLYGISYDDVYAKVDIDVHGGLTYSDFWDLKKSESGEIYWVGFDCCHSNDFSPGIKIFGILNSDNYRTMEYTKDETENLAVQLLNAKTILNKN